MFGPVHVRRPYITRYMKCACVTCVKHREPIIRNGVIPITSAMVHDTKYQIAVRHEQTGGEQRFS